MSERLPLDGESGAEVVFLDEFRGFTEAPAVVAPRDPDVAWLLSIERITRRDWAPRQEPCAP